MTFKNKLRALMTTLYKDDRGQSTTEYILILAVVVMIAMKFKKEFGVKLTGTLDQLGNQIQDAASTN